MVWQEGCRSLIDWQDVTCFTPGAVIAIRALARVGRDAPASVTASWSAVGCNTVTTTPYRQQQQQQQQPLGARCTKLAGHRLGGEPIAKIFIFSGVLADCFPLAINLSPSDDVCTWPQGGTKLWMGGCFKISLACYDRTRCRTLLNIKVQLESAKLVPLCVCSHSNGGQAWHEKKKRKIFKWRS